VVFVADGDTFDATGPEGRVTVRLLGINTPEHGECGFTEARDELRRLLERAPLTLIQDQSARDSFGRLLRYVENADGVDAGAAMVDAGRAISRRYWPDTARNDHYDALEAAARDAGRGAWSECDAPAAGAEVSIELHADAAGPDNENLNDEWVRLTNTSPVALDLEGWVVADSTASNRYALHGVMLDPGASVTLYTGCGEDAPGVRYWCTDGYPIWNNDGDTVFVRDPSGATVAFSDY
jgi:micrococcal nuclease